MIFSLLFVFFVMISGASANGAQVPEEGTHATETFNQQEYSLLDLYTIALERSEKVKISEEDLIIAEREKDRARSAYLPTISASGDYIRYSGSKISESDFGGFAIQPDYSSVWGIRLNETLSLSGREFTAYNISKMGIETSRYNLYAFMEEYLLNVSVAYYDVLKANKAVEITTANVERLTKHRDAAQTRFRVGEVTKTAVLRAEAELSGAQAKLVEAQNLFNLTKAVLARVVGIEGDFTLKETALKRQEALDLSLLEKEAFAERAEIKSSTIQKQIAEDDVRYTKGAYWPTLSLEGVYEKRDEDPSSPFFLDESIYGILRINFPFYEGGLRKAEVKQAEARHKQSELMYEDLKKTIAIEVENAYLDLKTQEEILESLQDQVTFAQDNYNTVSKQFDYGLTNSIDVMDANTLLVEAERDFFRAQYNYQLSLIMLKRATGTLLKTVMKLDAREEE
jgi:outer membrane protein